MRSFEYRLLMSNEVKQALGSPHKLTKIQIKEKTVSLELILKLNLNIATRIPSVWVTKNQKLILRKDTFAKITVPINFIFLRCKSASDVFFKFDRKLSISARSLWLKPHPGLRLEEENYFHIAYLTTLGLSTKLIQN